MALHLASRRARRAVVFQLESLDSRTLLSLSGLPVVGPSYPTDPQFAQEWGLNSGIDVDIDAPEAWTVTTGAASTIVAIIDSGIDLKSPEFAGRLWLNPAASRPGRPVFGWNFVAGNGNVQDDYGHGTHVAGIFGAAANNGKGIVGVDWNARIMPLKVLNARGAGAPDDVAAAIRFAADHGARVINASWSTTEPIPGVSEAIAYAGSKGAVFVVSAGNDAMNLDARPSYPAAYHLPNVIVVAAVDPRGNLADFSNHGASAVDVAAPGVDVYATYASRTGYATLSGTSMAAPYVSGVVSLLVGLHPEWSAEQLVQRVLATVKPLPGLEGKTATGGIVSAAAAVGVAGSGLDGNRYAGPPPIAPSVGVAANASRPRPIRAPAVRTPLRLAPVPPRAAPPTPPRLVRSLPGTRLRSAAAGLA